MNKNLSGSFLENVRKKRRVTVRTAEKCVKRKPKITYDGYKQYETEEVGGEKSQTEHGSSSQPLTVYSHKKQQLAFSKSNYIGITNYETSKLSIYKTYYKRLFSYCVENNLKVIEWMQNDF